MSIYAIDYTMSSPKFIDTHLNGEFKTKVEAESEKEARDIFLHDKAPSIACHKFRFHISSKVKRNETEIYYLTPLVEAPQIQDYTDLISTVKVKSVKKISYDDTEANKYSRFAMDYYESRYHYMINNIYIVYCQYKLKSSDIIKTFYYTGDTITDIMYHINLEFKPLGVQIIKYSGNIHKLRNIVEDAFAKNVNGNIIKFNIEKYHIDDNAEAHQALILELNALNNELEKRKEKKTSYGITLTKCNNELKQPMYDELKTEASLKLFRQDCKNISERVDILRSKQVKSKNALTSIDQDELRCLKTRLANMRMLQQQYSQLTLEYDSFAILHQKEENAIKSLYAKILPIRNILSTKLKEI